MNRFIFWKKFLLITALNLGTFGPLAFAYEGDVHQQMTFLAAKQMSRCESLPDLMPDARLTALDTRYIVKANVAQAGSNVFVRMFRWNYYNPMGDEVKPILGIIDTRFDSHFNGLLDELSGSDARHQRLSMFGRVLSYVQDVTSPAKVVPVFTGRWWRFSFSDRFDKFPVDVPRLQRALGDYCADLEPHYLLEKSDITTAMNTLMRRTAVETLRHVEMTIDGFPATWASYWQPATNEEEFGSYGAAGNNFGVRAEFPCGDGEQCLLLKDDPLYQDFAHLQHLSAVRATIQAMFLMQYQEQERKEAAR
jgi:hypothetical protein